MSIEDINKLRDELLRECIASPSLVQDWAGIESYLAETYSYRTLFELIQNADDACSRKIKIVYDGSDLVFINDGRLFNYEDIESICRSAYSRKTRGDSIGFRGIGFKSTVGIAKEIVIISGKYQLCFSRTLTSQALNTSLPVPLIRIPHLNTRLIEEAKAFALKYNIDLNVGAFFYFSNVNSKKLLPELTGISGEPLMFLRTLAHIELAYPSNRRSYSLSRTKLEFADEQIIIAGEKISSYIITRGNSIQLAYKTYDNRSLPAERSEALVYAYLPTKEQTGFGIIINGDFSTDPSHTMVVVDQRTEQALAEAADLMVKEMQDALSCSTDLVKEQKLACLVPLVNPGLAEYSAGLFTQTLLEAIRKKWQTNSPKIVLRPAWINRNDFEKLYNAKNIISEKQESIIGLVALLMFLGVREAVLEDVTKRSGVILTPAGCADILLQARLLKLQGKSSYRRVTESNLPLIYTDSGPLTVNELQRKRKSISKAFLNIIAERTCSEADATALFEEFVEKSAIPLFEKPTRSTQQQNISNEILSTGTLRLKKNWQGAESLVKDALENLGWVVRDVSRQNLGYDLEANYDNRKMIYVEVKLVESLEKKFTMTINEESVARIYGEDYFIAIVCANNKSAEIVFVASPVTALTMERICKQWAYECANYPKKGIKVVFA